MKDSIVERRLRYIARQKELGHGVNVRFDGLKPEGSGPLNRHGLPSVPVGQRVVENWPVLDLGDIPNVSLADWKLEATGLVENPVTLSWDDFMALPQVEDVSDFHCVTSWSRLGNHWKGVKFGTIAELVVPKESAAWILCTGYDRDGLSGESYTTNLPLDEMVKGQAFVAYQFDDKPLAPVHGGPARLVVPHLYFWKSAKWIRGLRFMERNQPGFWESLGYHLHGDPWKEERYSGD